MNQLTKEQQEMPDLLDKALHEVLTDGVTALDDDGKVVKLTPPAAMFNAIIKRIQQIGVSSMRVAGSPQEALLNAARERGWKVPAMGDDDGVETDAAQHFSQTRKRSMQVFGGARDGQIVHDDAVFFDDPVPKMQNGPWRARYERLTLPSGREILHFKGYRRFGGQCEGAAAIPEEAVR